MTGKQRVGDLEIEEDMAYQQREWAVQRIGWIVIVLVLLAALSGLLGRGSLSRTTVGEGHDPLWIEFERFAQLNADTSLRVHVSTGTGSEEARIWLARPYLDSIQVHQITPDPDRVEASSEQVIYVFRVSEPGQLIDITFLFEPREWGRLEGQVGVPGAQSLRFNQLIFP